MSRRGQRDARPRTRRGACTRTHASQPLPTPWAFLDVEPLDEDRQVIQRFLDAQAEARADRS